MMKRNNIYRQLSVLCFLYLSFSSLAQQDAQFTHYMYDLMSINPAYAGSQDGTQVALLSRTQWQGFDDNPRTNVVTAHTPFSTGQSGLGLTVMSDVVNPVSRFYVDGNYAHRLRLSEQLTLSMGLKASMTNVSANLADIVSGDNAFTNESYYNFNFGLGVFLYSNNYYVGLSSPRIITKDPMANDYSPADLVRHIYFTAGYVYVLNSDLKLKPSGLLKAAQAAPLSVDVALEAIYADRYSFGANYRVKESLGLLAGIFLFDKLKVSYAYDIPMSKLAGYSKGSHEIYLSFDLRSFEKRMIRSPRFF